LKVIDKRSIENLPSFVDTLLYQEALKHPHIIEQYDHFESKERYYVSMEVCDGGELFDRVLELGHFEEEEARSFLERFLSAIEYCHKNSVVHRDIKPENVLYRNRTDYNDFVLSVACCVWPFSLDASLQDGLWFLKLQHNH
jgi:serine/threonine protein kinase